MNNKLVFRGGIKIVQRRKKVVFEGSKSSGEMNKKRSLKREKIEFEPEKEYPPLLLLIRE